MENMELKKKKLIFCFPYRGVGGVNRMFIRLSSYLKTQGYNTAVIDYLDGDMSINRDEEVELIQYDDNEKVYVPNNAILILQSMTPWSIFASLVIPKETQLIFITTLPANFYPVIPGLFIQKMYEGKILAQFIWHTILKSEFKKSRLFLKLLDKTNANLFLDNDIMCNLSQSFKIPFYNTDFMPLFSDIVDENKYIKNVKSNEKIFNCAWVGRLADFKIHILNYVIEDLYKYSNKNKTHIRFFIVGSGDYESMLLDFKSDFFTIQKKSYISPNDLDNFLLDLDLLFAMGTSALDSAKLGLPTIRLDYSFTSVRDYKYKFLYETKGYSLGEHIGSKCYNEGYHDIDNVMHNVTTNKNDISDKTYKFYNDNHSLVSSVDKLIDKIYKSSLNWGLITKENLTKSNLYSLWNIIKRKKSV
jgi:hypothetical protein